MGDHGKVDYVCDGKVWEKPCSNYIPMSMAAYCAVCGFSHKRHEEEAKHAE